MCSYVCRVQRLTLLTRGDRGEILDGRPTVGLPQLLRPFPVEPLPVITSHPPADVGEVRQPGDLSNRGGLVKQLGIAEEVWTT
jgi:hypothetical protein